MYFMNSQVIITREKDAPTAPEFVDIENPYPEQGVVLANQGRGLLFPYLQSSIARGFEFVQSQWVNQRYFRLAGDGAEPIIARKDEPRRFSLPRKVGSHSFDFKRWAQTTDGEYFLTPSITALKQLAGKA